jgi:hypothetical protein
VAANGEPAREQPAAAGYEWDIFISYRHRAPMLDWLRNHFYPLLITWLPTFLTVEHDPRIFVDLNIETGNAWPPALSRALQRSRFMVAIWTPDYFKSPWCVAEWTSFREREAALGLQTEDDTSGLMYPLRYADGDSFPLEAQHVQQMDIREWNTPHLVFKDNPRYVEFDRKVQQIAERLGQRILQAPPWRPDWPRLEMPITYSPPTVPLARLM